jgi:hypothetical protein
VDDAAVACEQVWRTSRAARAASCVIIVGCVSLAAVAIFKGRAIGLASARSCLRQRTGLGESVLCDVRERTEARSVYSHILITEA